ncbi:CLUMA_CG017863, isoform A [Clunio marinus]|uniref:CLUMA_CG017863, isoform A n=1 Tax=Clunio marinus TaxID=568069 RepID=A0A1J1IYN9_9DIPT|nr:CLUMA_CG017863, isoform A [Clunio marinus]
MRQNENKPKTRQLCSSTEQQEKRRLQVSKKTTKTLHSCIHISTSQTVGLVLQSLLSHNVSEDIKV